MTTRGTTQHPLGGNSYVALADHVFDDDNIPGMSRNSPQALQDIINADRTEHPGEDTPLLVPAQVAWVVLDRLATAEESVATKRSKALTNDQSFGSAASRARSELAAAIVQARKDAIRYCEESADAAGRPYSEDGLEHATAQAIIGTLLVLGWITEPESTKP